MMDLLGGFWLLWFGVLFCPWFFFFRHWDKEPLPGVVMTEEEWNEANGKSQNKPDEMKKSTDPDDYWDEGGVREYGATYSHGGATVRHPKNVNRAYAGGAERLHDGEW